VHERHGRAQVDRFGGVATVGRRAQPLQLRRPQPLEYLHRFPSGYHGDVKERPRRRSYHLRAVEVDGTVAADYSARPRPFGTPEHGSQVAGIADVDAHDHQCGGHDGIERDIDESDDPCDRLRSDGVGDPLHHTGLEHEDGHTRAARQVDGRVISARDHEHRLDGCARGQRLP
jgi:hypothetical protein